MTELETEPRIAESFCDEQLTALVAEALERLDSELRHSAPTAAGHVATWMGSLSATGDPLHFFIHTDAFPSLLVPWWIAKDHGRDRDLGFHRDLAYSSINAYCFIRMIDNCMDGEATVEHRLLPALGLFHSRFQGAYRTYFEPGHPFWSTFAAIWDRSADVTLGDALFDSIDRRRFEEVSGQKFGAAKIPMAATCFRCGLADSIEPWSQLMDLLGRWHQMVNDLFDWHKDSELSLTTFVLSEAERRRRPGEVPAAWLAREGFSWGLGILNGWMSEMAGLARRLGCPELESYLDRRQERLMVQSAAAGEGLDSLARLLAAFGENPGDGSSGLTEMV